MLKKIAVGSAALIAAAVLAAASPAAERMEKKKEKSGIIKVGVNPTLPPLGKKKERNEIVGFDVDFATRVAKMLGVKIEVVQVGSPDRIPFVASGKRDFVMGEIDA